MGCYWHSPPRPVSPLFWEAWFPSHSHFSLINEPRYDDWMYGRLRLVQHKTPFGYDFMEKLVCDVMQLNNN